MAHDEHTLIREAQQGDHRAFEILVSRHDRRILAVAYDLTGNLEDAQDIYQDALIAAYHALPQFRQKSRFSTWLYRIVVNKALKFRKKPRLKSTEFDETTLPYTNSFSPENQVLNLELQTQITSALDNLSKHERLAFVLCHHQGFKIRQVAEWMACSEGAIKSYLHRGRQKMKQALQPYLKS